MTHKLRSVSWTALALCTSACAAAPRTPSAVFPQLPDLSAETRKPCPPAGEISDPSLGALAIADAALAIEYARCRARAAAAVGAYETAQRLLRAVEPRP